MRVIFSILALFAGVIGYGAHRQHQVKLEREARIVAMQDSIRLADSLDRAAAAAEAEATTLEQLAAREAAALGARRHYEQTAERATPLKIQKPKTRVVYVTKPLRPNRPR
jgi:hypothetical protein